jgi:predicted component of type VI protein secretion system
MYEDFNIDEIEKKTVALFPRRLFRQYISQNTDYIGTQHDPDSIMPEDKEQQHMIRPDRSADQPLHLTDRASFISMLINFPKYDMQKFRQTFKLLHSVPPGAFIIKSFIY